MHLTNQQRLLDKAAADIEALKQANEEAISNAVPGSLAAIIALERARELCEKRLTNPLSSVAEIGAAKALCAKTVNPPQPAPCRDNTDLLLAGLVGAAVAATVAVGFCIIFPLSCGAAPTIGPSVGGAVAGAISMLTGGPSKD